MDYGICFFSVKNKIYFIHLLYKLVKKYMNIDLEEFRNDDQYTVLGGNFLTLYFEQETILKEDSIVIFTNDEYNTNMNMYIEFTLSKSFLTTKLKNIFFIIFELFSFIDGDILVFENDYNEIFRRKNKDIHFVSDIFIDFYKEFENSKEQD